MANTITIDLDSLSEERAQKLAGFILTYAGLDEPESIHNLEFEDAVERAPAAVQSVSEPSPQEAFGSQSPTYPSVIEPRISTAGPTLVIPNPPTITVAPAATTTVPASNSITSVDIAIDKTGLPWDSRIHSAAKTFNADGTWRARRGLADGYAEQIERELRQVMAIPSPSTAPTMAAVATSTSIPPAPLPPATPSADIRPYLDLMNKVSSALAGGRLNSTQLQKVCDAVGLPTFVSLGTRLDLVPVVVPMIDGILAGTSV